MAKRKLFRKCFWICIILWIIFCMVKGVYEEVQQMNQEMDAIEKGKTK